MAHAEIMPGVCGLSTTVETAMDDQFSVEVRIESQCKHIQALADRLESIDVLSELRLSIDETAVYRLAGECGLHAACPVPSGLLKAVEVAAGMALPKDVHIKVTND